MTAPTKTKVRLLVEAEVENVDGFDEARLRKVALGGLWMCMCVNPLVKPCVMGDEIGVEFPMVEGNVALKKPVVISEVEC